MCTIALADCLLAPDLIPIWRTSDNLSLFFSSLSLRLSLSLRRHGLQVRRNDVSASTSTSTREWKSFYSLMPVLMLASLRRTRKPGRRKHKHKCKHKALMLALHRFTHSFHVLAPVLVLMLASSV